MVFNYRQKVLKVLSACCSHDIDLGRDWRWRWDLYEQVSFSKMVYCFWRRISSFYPDKAMVDPDATGPKIIRFDRYTPPKGLKL
jgi:hypothetical protein